MANAPKDGHTLLLVSLAIAVNPWPRKLPYDTVNDFPRIAILATAPTAVSVNQELPVKSIKELVALTSGGALRYRH